MARSGTKSRPLTRAGQWIVYALFRCVEAVLAALPLGPRERLVLVDAAGSHILLGVTAQQITALHQFSEPVVLPDGGNAADFALRLREALGRGGRA